MISCCRDFEEEETMLQSIARTLGVRVDRTPKCHCELAGEGIEYAWACSKNKYRSLLLEKKRGKENFMKSVRMCISRDIITRERAQKFARRARRYIMGYHVLHQMQHNDVQGNGMTSSGKDLAIVPVKLEQMIKNSRHTGVLLTSITPFARKYSKRQHQHHQYSPFFNFYSLYYYYYYYYIRSIIDVVGAIIFVGAISKLMRCCSESPPLSPFRLLRDHPFVHT
jgi:hypothetical protein